MMKLHGLPQHRCVFVDVAKGGKYDVPKGVRVVSYKPTLISGRPFVRLLLDISLASYEEEDATPMPKGWDFRTLMRRV